MTAVSIVKATIDIYQVVRLQACERMLYRMKYTCTALLVDRPGDLLHYSLEGAILSLNQEIAPF